MCLMRSGKSEQVLVSMSIEVRCPVRDGTGTVETLKGAERYNIFVYGARRATGAGRFESRGDELLLL